MLGEIFFFLVFTGFKLILHTEVIIHTGQSQSFYICVYSSFNFKTLLQLNIKTMTIASSEHIMIIVLHSFTTAYKMPVASVIHRPH